MNRSNSFPLLPFSLPKFTKNRSRVFPLKNSIDFFSSQNLELLFSNVEKVLFKPILALSNQSHFKVVFHIFRQTVFLFRFGVSCERQTREESINAPSYAPADRSCTFQSMSLLNSCVAKDPARMRLCPCRDYQPQQVALCKNCD